jgi:hypothetical protein
LFFLSHSAAHSGGLAANFVVLSFAERKLTVSTLRELKSVKTTLSNARFVQITESNEDLV